MQCELDTCKIQYTVYTELNKRSRGSWSASAVIGAMFSTGYMYPVEAQYTISSNNQKLSMHVN